jgi:hypothetical protein
VSCLKQTGFDVGLAPRALPRNGLGSSRDPGGGVRCEQQPYASDHEDKGGREEEGRGNRAEGRGKREEGRGEGGEIWIRRGQILTSTLQNEGYAAHVKHQAGSAAIWLASIIILL